MDLEDFDDFIDFLRRVREQGPRRYLRDYSVPFNKYTPQEFFSRYRFTPNTVKKFLVSLLEPYLKKSSKRGLPFAPDLMILATFCYYATGSFQYAVSPLLMTPFISPCNTTQKKYNTSHIKTRNTIERAFGVWKCRFPCLQVGMETKLKTTVAVVCACAVLHYYAILYNDVVQFVNEETANKIE